MKNYTGRSLDRISFPLGGFGTGMICLNGTGSFGSVSLRHKPELFHNPNVFSAVTVLGETNLSRVVEAPVPESNIFANVPGAGTGLWGKNYGLPRFSQGLFSARFPFAEIDLKDNHFPLTAKIMGWSPFVPGDEDSSSLPFAGVEYTFQNISDRDLSAVYYFSAFNFMKCNDLAETAQEGSGFILRQPSDKEHPYYEGAFMASVDEPCSVDTAWFRGIWFDAFTMLWKNIAAGVARDAHIPDLDRGKSPGASLAVRFSLKPGETKKIRLRLSWYVPYSDLKTGDSEPLADYPVYRPWYIRKVDSIQAADKLWKAQYDDLYHESKKFSDCFFSSTVPEEILDAASANLSILKSPTILRQSDGRLWGWEGCGDDSGCCDGTCTHVWNYAQSICNLFPRMERTIREAEFYEAQDDETGHQQFRVALPIRKTNHTFHAASDGQLGGIIKVYRDWRITGDTDWLEKIWPRVKMSLNFCMNQWDPDKEGIIKQPHHNTYDIEFWGPDGMITGFYLGALRAASEMAEALGDDSSEYRSLYAKGKDYLETELFNGEYFYQKTMWDNLKVPFDPSNESSEVRVLLESEGPKYQYKNGCLSDMVLGVWLAEISGLADILTEDKLEHSLKSIYTYNFKEDLTEHANPQRPGYATNREGGLLLCTWPKGGKPSLPFVYCDEVWTGIEYHVASHLISKGMLEEGLRIVRTCRERYNGIIRNPFNEYECGHWYARAMSSYGLLWAYTGLRYDALTKTLYYSLKNSDKYRSFLATASGYGMVTVQDGVVSVDVLSGTIEVNNTVRT